MEVLSLSKWKGSFLTSSKKKKELFHSIFRSLYLAANKAFSGMKKPSWKWWIALTITNWSGIMEKRGFCISVVTFIRTCSSFRVAVIAVIGSAGRPAGARGWSSTGACSTIGGRFQPGHLVIFGGWIALGSFSSSSAASESASRSHLKGVYTS